MLEFLCPSSLIVIFLVFGLKWRYPTTDWTCDDLRLHRGTIQYLSCRDGTLWHNTASGPVKIPKPKGVVMVLHMYDGTALVVFSDTSQWVFFYPVPGTEMSGSYTSFELKRLYDLTKVGQIVPGFRELILFPSL
jgi:hypothetical protein